MSERNQWKMLSKMIAIVAQEFSGRLDKGGKPYTSHCMRVMNGVNQDDPEEMQMAMGHDLLEDSDDWTVQRLLEEGFSERVVTGIDALTHKDGEHYMNDYIKRVALRPDTKAVKRADLRDNSNITRLKGIRQKDFERLEKYSVAYLYLSD